MPAINCEGDPSISNPTIESNPESNRKITGQNAGKVTVTFSTIVDILKSEPQRKFTVSEIVRCTPRTREAVKVALSRYANPENSAPIRRVGHGVYQYDPLKNSTTLEKVAREGELKFENVVLMHVTSGAHPPTLLPGFGAPSEAQNEHSNSSIPTPKTGYPRRLPLGQQITWKIFDNGTEMIHISANGVRPFSPDHLLTLIEELQREGVNDSWVCASVEVNADSRDLRVDTSISLPIFTGLLIKIYQHGPFARVEFADRRIVPLKEVLELVKGICTQVDTKEHLREYAQFKEALKKMDGEARLSLNISRKTRERLDECKKEHKISGGKPGKIIKG